MIGLTYLSNIFQTEEPVSKWMWFEVGVYFAPENDHYWYS